MNYNVNTGVGTTAWNLLANANPPAVAGPVIEHPAANAAAYFCFAMDGAASVDAGGPYAGLFTWNLCGCIAGFLIRTNGGAVRRITGYHKTFQDTVPGAAVALFNAAGTNGPQPGDVDYLIVPDKVSHPPSVPHSVSGLVGLTIHYYMNPQRNVSWVVSFNGDMGEMSAAFTGSRTAGQNISWGTQVVLPPPPTNSGCCVLI
ncbi:hypothetical protein GRF61_08165 [Azoarcus sp. TTM-91]|uniref:hypothetical protein n=1 Tax=Azoarcus sp. TTM-91 TaxID=2691581 RepID=UPI00145CBA1B|nr:hypothetical protein [Azoarcus sp. TTM-91]NMG34420.1 hypothetical protein [Azoarcus sp. TTM-91]